jgi:ferredoxin-nitrite reductase
MSAIPPLLRLDGIYQQRQKGFFMQRVKLPAGMISAPQAAVVAELADRFARGLVHLTTRGSMELHWLTEADLPAVAASLASVGLVTRGACGGAVRGVVCGGFGAAAAPELEAMVRRLHRHFTGNPRYETLPKKFKIAVEADTTSGRHLIQDIALIPVAGSEGALRYDIWAAGGLGREPGPGFLLAEAVPAERVIPLIEAVLKVYQLHTPAGKRLKHLVRETGREVFRQLVFAHPGTDEDLPVSASLAERLFPEAKERIEVPVVAGELKSADLLFLSGLAERLCGGMLLITADQNVVLHLESAERREEAEKALKEAGLSGGTPQAQVCFRICPGNHECILGLAPTREVAEAMVAQMGPEALTQSWAISGCPNCCAQPQLSDNGVVCSRIAGADGERTPRFDLYRMGEGPFAAPIRQGLTLDELLAAVREL